MEALLHSSSFVAAMAASNLFSAAWQGAVLALCVYLCLRIFPSMSAAARSIVWMNVFALLVLLHGMQFFGIHGNNALGSHSAIFQLDSRWSLAIATVWLSLSLLRAAQLIASAIRLKNLARRATPIQTDVELNHLLQIRTFKASRSAQLCTSDEVERPSVLGFLHPRILFPPDLLRRLTPSELRQVVLHEMEHLRRGDDWTNLLQKLALVVFPLNPALLWVEHRLCAERELACDDSVLQSSCGRKAYAICLTRLAEHSMLRRSLSLALGAWERQSELVRRVHRILRRPTRAMSHRQTLVLTSSLMAGVLAITLALARSPQLVSFAVPQMQVAAQALPPMPFREASIRQSGLPVQAQTIKAVMPQHSPAVAFADKPANPAKPTQKNVTLHRNRPHYQNTQQAWIVMTSWSEMDAMPQMVFAVSQADPTPQNRTTSSKPQVNRISYAAVRLPDGWLIVEI